MRAEIPTTPQAAALLNEVRHALGLSFSEMAQALGLKSAGAGDSGADSLRQMERGTRPVSGPAHMLLRYMAGAAGLAMDAPPEALAVADAVRVRLQGGKG